MSFLELRSVSKVSGQLAGSGRVRIFLGESLDSAAASAAGDVIPKNAVVTTPTPEDSIVSPATIVLIVSVLGLLVIGMPLTGAAVAWLLGGHQPSAVSRQPLE